MRILQKNTDKIKCSRCGNVPDWIKGGGKKRYCPACHVIAFIETNCTHIKGRWAGHPFRFVPWQIEDVIIPAFGTLKEDGRRQYRFVYVEIPKKNGKSELGSAIALYLLVGDGEDGGEVYSAAGDTDQASLIYYPAAQMVRNSKALKNRLKVIDSRRRIVDFKTNSFYQVLSAEHHTKHGINPSGICFDETHAQPNRELWDVLTEGTDVAREQQMILVTTTAGISDKNSIGWEIHDTARRVKKARKRGQEIDSTFLPIIYATDEKDDWESEKVWAKCNPSLGHLFDLENLRDHYKSVKTNPARLNNFLRFRLNKWVGQITRYIPMDKWDECLGKIDIGHLLKRLCFGGLDLSSTQDLTAFVLVFPPEKSNEKWLILPKFYVPEDKIQEKSKKDRVPYDMWQKAGFLTATPGNVVDYSFIRRDINNASKIYTLKEVAYDPWGAVKLATELNENDGIVMVEHRQGFKSMSPPTKDLLKMILGGDFIHDGNPVLRWNADNLAVKIDAAENVKPEKDKSADRIDGIVALIMALGRALINFEKKSVYEDRGLLVI
ncbi:MAG: terminase large subunit [Magnetococcus sp. WYHC-3]